MEGTRSRVGALRGVGASSLPTSDLFIGSWGLTSSSCPLMGLAEGLLQGLYQAQDSGAIAMEL